VDRQKDFYPHYLFEILMVSIMVMELVVVLALLGPPSLGRQIDFSAPYRPMPEWYFYWLYQMVRYFPGRWTFIGTVLLPLVAVLILILIPYIDRGKRGRLRAILAGGCLLLAFVIFTIIPWLNP